MHVLLSVRGGRRVYPPWVYPTAIEQWGWEAKLPTPIAFTATVFTATALKTSHPKPTRARLHQAKPRYHRLQAPSRCPLSSSDEQNGRICIAKLLLVFPYSKFISYIRTYHASTLPFLNSSGTSSGFVYIEFNACGSILPRYLSVIFSRAQDISVNLSRGRTKFNISIILST